MTTPNEFLNSLCKDVRLAQDDPIDSTRTRGLKTTILNVPAHKWRFKYKSIAVGGLLSQRELFTMLGRMRRQSFDWAVPLHNEPEGSAETSAPVRLAANAGSYNVAITRADNSQDYLKVGDWVKFSNHSKVYSVDEVVTGTNPVVKLAQPLEFPLTTSETMAVRDITVKVIQDPETDPVMYERFAGDLDATFEIELIEL